MRKKAKAVYRVEDATEIYKAIRGEFEFSADVFCKDGERARRAKWVCSNRLDRAEQVLIYLYAELGSVRDLAQMLGVARSTLGDDIKRIKDKIRREIALLDEKEAKGNELDA